MAKNFNSFKNKNIVSDDSDDDRTTEYECYRDEDDEGDRGFDPSVLLLEKLSLTGPKKKKKLLVLSLNGLLIYRVFRYSKGSFPKNRPPDGTYGKHLVFKRPFCEEFMRFCFDRFEIGIWSSAMEHNIDGVLNCVMHGSSDKFLFIWDQSECTDTGFKSLEKKDKPLFFKDLNKLWENEDNKLPWNSGKYSSINTLLIDDKPYKALLNPPNTAIFPKPYDSDDLNDDALDPKGELGQFLDGLADAEDVQSYVEKHPFGQPVVTPLHSDWAYYTKVMRRFRRK